MDFSARGIPTQDTLDTKTLFEKVKNTWSSELKIFRNQLEILDDYKVEFIQRNDKMMRQVHNFEAFINRFQFHLW